MRDLFNTDRGLDGPMSADTLGIDKMTMHKIINEDIKLPPIGSSTTTMLQRTNHGLLRRNDIATIFQLHCSSDVAPADFFFPPKVKTNLKGHYYQTQETGKMPCTQAHKNISVADFQGDNFEDF